MITDAISEFKKRVPAATKQWAQDKLAEVKENIQEIEKRATDEGWLPAIGELNKINQIGSSTLLPPLLRFGNIRAGEEMLPMLLPTKGINAIMLEDENVFGQNVTSDNTNMMQSILMRIVFSMTPGVLNVSVFDSDYGNSFPFYHSVKNARIRKQLYDGNRGDAAEQLINQLASEMMNVNQKITGYHDINSYNKDFGDMPLSYHLVLIDDFPKGFTVQSIERLKTIAHGGNAINAGIIIIINNCGKKNLTSGRNFGIENTISAIDDLKRECVVVYTDKSKKTFFRNWPKVSDYGVDFCKESLEKTDEAIIIDDLFGKLQNANAKRLPVSLEGWFNELKENELVWKGDATDGISVPVGQSGPRSQFYFSLGNESGPNRPDYFALIAGDPGMGKSTLLKQIVLSASFKYSSDELQLYIADFSHGGTDFNVFRNLPHLRALLCGQNREFAVRMMMDIDEECNRRSKLFAENGSVKYSEYREKTGKKLPRILFVVDECQFLLWANDSNLSDIRVAQSAKRLLNEGIRTWRRFGVGIILATQTIADVDLGAADTLITCRIALRMADAINSKLVLKNEAAVNLSESGHAIMNNQAGREDANQRFVSAMPHDIEGKIGYLTQKEVVHRDRYICENTDKCYIDEGNDLIQILKGESQKDINLCNIYIGKADLLRKRHTRIQLNRIPNSNLLILGSDDDVLKRMVVCSILQILQQSVKGSKIYILNCFNPGDKLFNEFDFLKDGNPDVVVAKNANATQIIAELHQEMKRRRDLALQQDNCPERIVFFMLNAHNCFPLVPASDAPRFSPNNDSNLLLELLSEGSSQGIHCIMHAFSIESLCGDRGILRHNAISYIHNICCLHGSSLHEYMSLARIRTDSCPEEVSLGRAVIYNGKIDGEQYEQCVPYTHFNKTLEIEDINIWNILTNYLKEQK